MHSAATVAPQNLEEAEKDDYVRKEMLDTFTIHGQIEVNNGDMATPNIKP